MSERDDINAVNSAENTSAASSAAQGAGSDENDITIRQNTPEGEAKPKRSLIDRLKMAFSTEEDPQTSADREGESLGESEGLLGGLFGRSKSTPAENDAPVMYSTDNPDAYKSFPGDDQ